MYPQALIDGDEKQAGEQHHGDDEAGRDQGLAARGPGDLGAFGADFLQECERVDH
jgi:hypothetical protein